MSTKKFMKECLRMIKVILGGNIMILKNFETQTINLLNQKQNQWLMRMSQILNNQRN